MRRLLRLIGVFFLTLFGLDFLVLLLDNAARLDFIQSFLKDHPRINWFAHTPYGSLALLGVAFVTLYGQYKVRQPYIIAQYTNARLCPDLHTATVQMMFDTQEKKPGWDEHKFDWNWFVELRLVNDSETTTTIHEIKVKVRAGGSWFSRLIHTTRRIGATIPDNVTDFQFYRREGYKFDPDREVPLPSLMDKIRHTPLTRGIGYEGWISVHVRQANQREMNTRPSLDLWVVDAYGHKHQVHLRRRNDERNWDMSFEIVERV